MNMTMTYDGTMVMPKNYAVVTEDEMTYVDGGGTVNITFSRDFLRDVCTAGLSTVCAIVGGIIGTAGTPLASIVFGAVGAGIGWIVGGNIARTYINSDKSISFYLPWNISGNYYIA